jgi:exodeoxyribonuclease V alpha subunit
MHKGILGTQNVNQSIQKLLNPKQEGKQEYLRGNQIFRVGDKVIQQKNNYEKGVFNGDIGFVVNISTEDQTLEIRFDQLSVTYNSKELIEIELAYAITVHKFQGSENQVIIIPIHSSQQQLLHRNLLYTAMSRAKKLLIMLGQVDTFEKAIQRIDQNQRLSALSLLFKEKNELFPEIIILPELGSADYQQRMKAIIS